MYILSDTAIKIHMKSNIKICRMLSERSNRYKSAMKKTVKNTSISVPLCINSWIIRDNTRPTKKPVIARKNCCVKVTEANLAPCCMLFATFLRLSAKLIYPPKAVLLASTASRSGAFGESCKYISKAFMASIFLPFLSKI